jgi:hypothetical protein
VSSKKRVLYASARMEVAAHNVMDLDPERE